MSEPLSKSLTNVKLREVQVGYRAVSETGEHRLWAWSGRARTRVVERFVSDASFISKSSLL